MAFWMPFVPKRLKNEEEYRDIPTSSEAVAGQTVPKWPEDIFEMGSTLYLFHSHSRHAAWLTSGRPYLGKSQRCEK